MDPVTLQVIRHYLVAAMDEVETNLARTAFSPIVYEYKDFAVTLLDPDGRTIAQSRGGALMFVSGLGPPLLDVLHFYPLDEFQEGDAVLTNYDTGSHLNNMVMYVPSFVDGKVAAFCGIMAHWSDVGGRAPGSYVTDTTDLFQEGIQLRSVKLYKAGQVDEELARLVRHNIRQPELSFGDMEAQYAACRLGALRFTQVATRYGIDTVKKCVEEMWRRSERFARDRVKELPDGVYEASTLVDDDGVTIGESIPLKVRVQIAGDKCTVDFSDMPPQRRGPINSGYHGGGVSLARVGFKSVIAPGLPADEGAWRALDVVLPMGTIVSAEVGAPLAAWNVLTPTIVDLIICAFGKALPHVMPAGHWGTRGVWIFMGKDPDTGRSFQTVETAVGGWGGRLGTDGLSAMRGLTHGDMRIVPVEVEEARYPFMTERFELRSDSAGAGEFRGGLGTVRSYRLPHGGYVTTAFDRRQAPPWGAMGGKTAAPARVDVWQPGDSEPQELGKVTQYRLEPGALVEFFSDGGGGWGNPLDRSLEAVERDVRLGYVTPDRAAADYGVIFDEQGTLEGETEERERNRAKSRSDQSDRAE